MSTNENEALNALAERSEALRAEVAAAVHNNRRSARRTRAGLLGLALLLFAGSAIAQPVVHRLDGNTYINGSLQVSGDEESQFAVVLCGQLISTGVSYLGPSVAAFFGSGADTTAGGTVCDALDSTTEATADAPLFTSVPFKVTGMYCKATDDGTLGVVFALRSAAAATSPAITCTASGSAGASDCRSTTGTFTDIAAGATIAVAATTAEDLSAQDGWCILFGALK